MYKHILLPTDGSKLSAKAVTQGIQFAKAIGAKVTAFHVTPELRTMLNDGFAVPNIASFKKRFDEESARRATKLLEEAKAGAQAAGVDCDCVSVFANVPYEAIIKHAKKARCDLIMMASHGRQGLQSLLLGSETAKVLTHSTIPVLVVR
jgi:nucleotide-binding universal stress UspA family protein